MNLRTTLVLWLLTFCFLPAQAQEKAKILGKTNEGATISLLRAADSSVVKLAIADQNGGFELDQLEPGSYILEISAVGFNTHHSRMITLSADQPVYDAGTINLQAIKGELQGVTVTATRKMIEVKPDKTVVNVEAAISNAGATALEVLEKSPGVSVDRDGNLSLKGRQGVLVMIDGKPSYLTGSDLVNLLNSMTANQLDQIEIMTNPPAKYDAAGNSGVINIKTKRNKQKGWNGNLNLAYTQGRYNRSTNSLTLNFKNEKLSVSLTYNYNLLKNFNDLYIRRTYSDDAGEKITGYFDQPTYMRIRGHHNGLRLGLDYSLNKKTTVGLNTSGFIGPRTYKSESIGYLMDDDRIVDSTVRTFSNTSNKWVNGTLNLNLRHTINPGSEITADLDYLHYDMTNRQIFDNQINVENGTDKQGQLKGDLPANIRIYAAKTDYSTNLKNDWKLEAGFKTSFVKTDNEANYFNANGTAWDPDYSKTNHFLYEENIQAAYVNSNKKLGKWSMQAGLRFEHTGYKGRQLGNPEKSDSSFKRQYSSLFPTVYITRDLDSNNTFTINTGRRIDRPAYQQLNPFLFFINEYTYSVGNPYIQPQFTWNFQVAHTYKSWLTTSLEYARTSQNFSQLFRTEGRVTIITEGNLATQQNLNLTVTANRNLTRWWTSNLSITAFYQEIKGQTKDFNSKTTSANGNINNQFKFGKGWSGELSGFYNAKVTDGQFTIYGFGQVAAGVGKQVLKGKGTIRLNARDIFFTQKIKGDIRYQNVLERFNQTRDSRQLTLSFSWRFGKQLGDSRKRNTNSTAEEQNRVRTGG